jgi:hypothetical protein
MSTEERKRQGYMAVGCTHFKRERERYRQSDYTLFKAEKEFIDNIILKCSKVDVRTTLNSSGKIHGIRIHDDYEFGFENIEKEGTENPFNMTHMRSGQYSDSETSTFGIGMKAAAISLCDKMTVFTRVSSGRFFKVVCDFIEMANEPVAEYSFDPRIFAITETEYRAYHPYEKGSTLQFESINPDIYRSTNEEDLTKENMAELSECYGEIIRKTGVGIYVNQRRVEPEKNYFLERECSPFNRQYKLYMIRFNEEPIFMCKNMNETDEVKAHKIYNKDTARWSALKPKDPLFWIVRKLQNGAAKIEDFSAAGKNKAEFSESICSATEPACVIFNGTFMMYHPDLNTESKSTNEDRYPKGRARLFRDRRCYGNWNIDSTDGNANMTDIRVEFQSKRLANIMGLTWNKNISKGHQNDLSCAMRSIIRMIHSELNANTSTGANEILYKEAIRLGIAVPILRVPTAFKDSKPKEDAKRVREFFSSEPREEASISTAPEKQNEPKTTLIKESAPLVAPLKEPDPVPSVRSVPAKQDIVLNAAEGIRSIQLMRNAEDWQDYFDDVKNLIKTDYIPKICSDQIELLFSFYENQRILFDVLISLIEQKYHDKNLESSPMSGGAKLYSIFMRKKNASAVASL